MKTYIIYNENTKFELGKAVQIGDGKDATIISTGITTQEDIKAKNELESQGFNIRVLDVHTIKPIDKEAIIRCAKETKRIITVEDHNIIGGLGSSVCEVLSQNFPKKIEMMGIDDSFGKSGKAEELMKYFKIDKDSIIEKIRNVNFV